MLWELLKMTTRLALVTLTLVLYFLLALIFEPKMFKDFKKQTFWWDLKDIIEGKE
jgi:hypothetical protein